MSKKKFVVRDTNKYGKGVYATQDIKAGEVIHEMGGTRLDVNETWKQILTGKIRVDDPLQIGRRTHLVLDSPSRFFNHSCEPNAGLRKNSELFAITNIPKGAEITFDYSLTSSPTNSWVMKCTCGSKLCRKKIGDILTVPKRRIEYYRSVGALQTYMKRLLPELEKNKSAVPLYDQKAIDLWEYAQR